MLPLSNSDFVYWDLNIYIGLAMVKSMCFETLLVARSSTLGSLSRLNLEKSHRVCMSSYIVLKISLNKFFKTRSSLLSWCFIISLPRERINFLTSIDYSSLFSNTSLINYWRSILLIWALISFLTYFLFLLPVPTFDDFSVLDISLFFCST